MFVSCSKMGVTVLIEIKYEKQSLLRMKRVLKGYKRQISYTVEPLYHGHEGDRNKCSCPF